MHIFLAITHNPVGGGCWMAKDDMTSQYLQLDFMSAVYVTGIITQGCSGSPSWTSQYKLEYQYDQLSFWRMYEDPVGKDKVRANDSVLKASTDRKRAKN